MISRRTLLHSLPAATLGTAGLAGQAQAEIPPVGRQVPAIYRARLGTIEITAISDGHIAFAPELMQGATPQAVDAALAASPQAQPLTGHVNAYVVNTAGRLCLIDAGGPAGFIPTLGRLGVGLAAAGIPPEAIEQVLLTHLHIDHIGGLTQPDGSAVFANASLTLAAAEHAFWTDPALMSAAPAGMAALITAAQAAIAAYGDRLVLLDGEADAAPGISILPIPGHTPGMIGFRIESGGDQLLMWGDVVHVPAVQFAHPDWHLAFDTDGAAAAVSRARVLDMVATDRIGVLGSHLPFPGQGHVTRTGTAYGYEAAYWDHFA